MVIVAPPSSSYKVLAKGNECEMHLLGVDPDYRGLGIGKSLVEKALAYSEGHGWSKMILWTQKCMLAAYSLNESCGFVKKKERSRDSIDFFVYERVMGIK